IKLLLTSLKPYWKLVVLALFLATVNQVFSLLDPLIFRHIIDSYVTRFKEYTEGGFFRGVGLLLAAAVGVALVSRVANTFRHYFITTTTQHPGAQLSPAGLRH